VDDAAVSSVTLAVPALPLRLLRRVGSALSLFGMGYVAWRLHGYGQGKGVMQLLTAHGPMLLTLALLCGAANGLLAYAWHALVRQHEAALSPLWSFRTYGMSQLARYVPGNIFHLVGRQAIGMAAGLAPRLLAQSSALELGLIAVAGAVYGMLIVPLMWPQWSTLASMAAFVLVAAGIALAVRLWLGYYRMLAFLTYLVYLALTGAACGYALDRLCGAEGIRAGLGLALPALYIVAWLAGLLTPGAPAGLGVRESVLLLLLGAMLAEHCVLTAALALRGASTVGDVLFYLLACGMPRPANALRVGEQR
jgi:hypothetical protein